MRCSARPGWARRRTRPRSSQAAAHRRRAGAASDPRASIFLLVKFLLVKAVQASISRDCKGAHTSLAVFLLESSTATSIWRQEADMARKPDRLAFVFAMVLAVAITVLTIKTWAGPPAPDSDSAAPIPPRETIYRPQHWNLY